MEMVLASGEIMKAGSMSHPKAPGWPHGPGPALTYLPFFSNAGYGIVTEMEFRLFPTPQEVGLSVGDIPDPLFSGARLCTR